MVKVPHISKPLRNHATAVDAERTKNIEGAFNYEFLGNGDLKVRAYLPDCYGYFKANNPINFIKNFRINFDSIKTFSFEKGKEKPAVEISFKISKNGELYDLSDPQLVNVKLKKTYTNEEFAEQSNKDQTTSKLLSYCKKAFKRNIGEYKNESDYTDVISAPFEYLIKHAFTEYAKNENLPLIERKNLNVINNGEETVFCSYKPAYIYGLFNITSILSNLYKDNRLDNLLKENRNEFQDKINEVLENPHFNELNKNDFIKGKGVQNSVVHTELNTTETKNDFFKSEIFNLFSSLTENIDKYNFLLNQTEEFLLQNIKDITKAAFLVPETSENISRDLNKFKISIKNLLREKPDYAIKIFNSIIESIPEVDLISFNKKIKFNDDNSLKIYSTLKLHAVKHNLELHYRGTDLNSSPNELIYNLIQKFNNSNIDIDELYKVKVNKKWDKGDDNKKLSIDKNTEPNKKIVQLEDPYILSAKRIRHIHPEFFNYSDKMDLIINYFKEENKSSKHIVLAIAKNLGYQVNEAIKIKEKSCDFILNLFANGKTEKSESLITVKIKVDKYEPQKFEENLNSGYDLLLDKIIKIQERMDQLNQGAEHYNLKKSLKDPSINQDGYLSH